MFYLIGLVPEYRIYKERNPNATDLHNDADLDPTMSQEDKVLMQNLSLKKGKCPEDIKGTFHKLMKMAYMPRKIETIMDSENQEVLKLFYTACVSQAVGKRKWNEFSKVKYLGSFVSPSDEAFAMLVLENNVAKWMNELRFGKDRSTAEQYKTLYSEGKSGRKWTQLGLIRYIELVKFCKEYRASEARKERYKTIEIMIKTCERSAVQGNNDYNDDDEDGSDIEGDGNGEAQAMEQQLLAMANGDL